jgi:hypothetical protein
VCRDSESLRQVLGNLDALEGRDNNERENFLEHYCTQYAYQPKLGPELVTRLERWLAAPRRQETQQAASERPGEVVGPASV